MTQLSDELVERRIREMISNIEPHVASLESLLSKFYGHHPIYDHGDEDGGAGLAHLEVLSFVFEDIMQGKAEESVAEHPIWREEERDTWSPFATEVSGHLYALWPHVVELISLRLQTDKPHGFADIAMLQQRFDALWSHNHPGIKWADGVCPRERDKAVYAAYFAQLPN